MKSVIPYLLAAVLLVIAVGVGVWDDLPELCEKSQEKYAYARSCAYPSRIYT